MSERSSLTIQAASRLIQTRLRQTVYQQLKQTTSHDWSIDFDLMLDFEKSVEAAAEASWRQTLQLWKGWELYPPDAEAFVALRACIMQGLTQAVMQSQRFILSRTNEAYANESEAPIKQWVDSFVQAFNPDLLLKRR